MPDDTLRDTHGRMTSLAKDPVRKLILRTMQERGLTKKDVSLKIGKGAAYMQQYLGRGIPFELGETQRHKLSELLGIDEAQLGGPTRPTQRQPGAETVDIPQHDVQAGAGNPVTIEEEPRIGTWNLPSAYIRHTLGLKPDRLALIQVRGDSMEPTLRTGDLVMVDLSDHSISQPGIFALYDGDGAVVKRIEKIPGSNPPRVRLISDNPLHSAYDVDPSVINIAGRVVWLGRRI